MPDDADVVLVLGPTEPFSSEEIATLERYADRGGNLFIALDADGVSTGADRSPPKSRRARDQRRAPAAKRPPQAASAAPSRAASAKPRMRPSAASRKSTPSTQVVSLASSRASGELLADVLANERQHVRLRSTTPIALRLVSNSFSSHASVSTLEPQRAARRGGRLRHRQPGRRRGATRKIDFAVRAPAGTLRRQEPELRPGQGQRQDRHFNLAAAVTRPVAPATEKPEPETKDDKGQEGRRQEARTKEMRAFVLADADALSDFVMGEVRGQPGILGRRRALAGRRGELHGRRIRKKTCRSSTRSSRI